MSNGNRNNQGNRGNRGNQGNNQGNHDPKSRWVHIGYGTETQNGGFWLRFDVLPNLEHPVHMLWQENQETGKQYLEIFSIIPPYQGNNQQTRTGNPRPQGRQNNQGGNRGNRQQQDSEPDYNDDGAPPRF